MPLQRNFRGLSDHLGSYQGGSLTFDLVRAVSLGINPEDFINPIRTLFTDGTLTAQDQIATHAPVPDGEMWRVRYWGVRSLDPNNTTAWSAVWSDDGSRFFGLESTTKGFDTPTPNSRRSMQGIRFNGQEGFVMFPAEALGWHLKTSAGAGAGAVFTTVIRYQLIKI